MKAKLIEKKYKYTQAVLPVSGVEFSGMVCIREGKIYSTDSIQCSIKSDEEAKNFSFTLEQPGDRYPGMREEQIKEWGEPTLNVSKWPAGVSVNDTVEEFKQFVISDIAE